MSGTYGREEFHQMSRSAQDDNLSIYAKGLIYQIKHGLLSNYSVQQLKRPNIPMFISCLARSATTPPHCL
ncbi:hypothetical protein F8S20_00915 [Nostoc sp. BAE]|nr:hypothetical protein [Nostoc commune BAE]